MKRRCSEPNTKPPTRIPTSSQPGLRQGKRLKVFTEVEVDHPLSCRLDASSMGIIKSARRSDDAKTSEFAFFKKLKEDAGHKFTSHSVHNEQINRSDNFGLRNSTINNSIENASLISEKMNVVNNGCVDIGSSMRVENATPVRFVPFISSLGRAGTPRNSEAHMKKACAAFDDVQQRPQDMEEYDHPLRPQGTQYGNVELFNLKRQKLRRWITDISFPEIDGLYSKGDDIVSKLISRLISKSKDNNNFKGQKFGQVETDDKSISAAYHDADLHCQKLQRITTRASTELKLGPYLWDDIPHNQVNALRGRILNLDALYSDDNKMNYWLRLWESDSELNGETWFQCTGNDSHCAFPLTRFRSVERVKDFGEFCQPNRYLGGSHLNTPMLGWDFDKKKTEGNLSLTFQDMELSTYPTSLAPWVDNTEFYRRGSITFQDVEPTTYPTSLAPWVDNTEFYCQGLLSSPSVHINEEPKGIFPLSRISSYNNHEYRVPVLGDEENSLPESGNISLALSCRKCYLSPVKDYCIDTGFHSQDHWFISKIFSQGNHHSQVESLLPSELVLGLDWKRFPISCFPTDVYSSSYHALEYPTNQVLTHHFNEHDDYETCLDGSFHEGTLAHFSEEAIDDLRIHDWSSSCFQISLD